MLKRYAIGLILVLALAGCGTETSIETNENTIENTNDNNNTNTSADMEVVMGDIFTLGVGDEAVFTAEDLHVRFDSVLEDSRCPTNVTCVWAGQARIAVSVWQGTADPTTLEFNTNTAAGETVLEHTYEGYTIRLESVDPYPADTVAIPEDEYRATLQVTPAG